MDEVHAMSLVEKVDAYRRVIKGHLRLAGVEPAPSTFSREQVDAMMPAERAEVYRRIVPRL